MRATRLIAVGDVRTESVAEPEPGPGEILVRVEAAGICGTDRHLHRGEFPSAPPVTLWHEFSGIVVGRGAGVAIAEGARVACDPNDWCGSCDACLRGRVNLCARNVATGIHRDGGFADYAVFPARKAIALPADLDPRLGAFCEPLACTLHGVDIGAPVAGERVLVVGGGVIGLLAVQLAALAGAEVALLTRHPAKRALAARLGATATAATPAELLALWPEGADLTLECAGVAETVAGAPRLTRSGGRVVVLGVLAAGERVAIEPFDLLFREVQLRFAFINPFTQARAAALIASGRIAVAPLISREIALAEAAAAIAAPPAPGEVKVLVRPEAGRSPLSRPASRRRRRHWTRPPPRRSAPRGARHGHRAPARRGPGRRPRRAGGRGRSPPRRDKGWRRPRCSPRGGRPASARPATPRCRCPGRRARSCATARRRG